MRTPRSACALLPSVSSSTNQFLSQASAYTAPCRQPPLASQSLSKATLTLLALRAGGRTSAGPQPGPARRDK